MDNATFYHFNLIFLDCPYVHTTQDTFYNMNEMRCWLMCHPKYMCLVLSVLIVAESMLVPTE